MVLAAGLGGVSLFALGYIILAFWTLWQGTNLYIMRNYARTMKRWNTVLLYTVFVMFCKVALQVSSLIKYLFVDFSSAFYHLTFMRSSISKV